MKNGDKDKFQRIWAEREETLYNHWTRNEPSNQIQLAFRNHWTLFKELMENDHFGGGLRCLEVGCGRGTVSAYFSDAEFDCTLLDISDVVVARARQIFQRYRLKGKFLVGDANRLPFDAGAFDIVVSIGLLEHFENVGMPLQEQIRVLAPGGLLLCYVVPEYKDNVQKSYDWINELLKGYVEDSGRLLPDKNEVYRSDEGSQRYTQIMKANDMKKISSSGVYSLPMISHSIDFPFSLMPKKSEIALVRHFRGILAERASETKENPWLCDEGYGQAFLVWGYR